MILHLLRERTDFDPAWSNWGQNNGFWIEGKQFGLNGKGGGLLVGYEY